MASKQIPTKKYNLSTSYSYLPDTMHYSNCIIENAEQNLL